MFKITAKPVKLIFHLLTMALVLGLQTNLVYTCVYRMLNDYSDD